MQSRKSKRLNGKFLRECRRQAMLQLCGLMDAQLSRPRFATLYPDTAEAFERFIDQARIHLAIPGRSWTKAQEQQWLREAGATWWKYVRRHNPDA